MSLFPLIAGHNQGASTEDTLPLYREIDWDFKTNKPVWRDGNPVFVTGARAVLIWAWNALHTERFAHAVYSADYGLDCSTLLGRSFSQQVQKAEAIRIVRDTLMINPYITNVSQINAFFNNSVLQISLNLITIYGEVTIDECDITL